MTVRMLSAASSAALLAALVAAGAAHSASPAEGETLAPPEAQTFTYRETDEFPSIDPSLIEDASGGHVSRQLFEGLYSQDAEGNVVPGTALSHEVSEDGLTYTFTLRPEAKWSDGTPVTAEDFVYSWRRVADPATASNYAWYIELMKVKGAAAVIAGEAAPDTLGVRAVDDHTLEVTIDSPIPFFPQMLTHYTTFPIPRQAIEAHGDQWTQPGNMVGNGAYVLSERVPQERLVMTRNPEYWDAGNVIIETITALVINDENQAMTRWQAGELDYTDVPTGQYPRYLEEHPTEAFAGPNLFTYFYAVNLREDGPEALKDVRVREALSLAIDRDIIVDSVLAGGQEPAYTLTHPAVAGWEVPEVPAAAMTQEERNARAKELMAEAGYGEGGEPVTFEILYNTSRRTSSSPWPWARCGSRRWALRPRWATWNGDIPGCAPERRIRARPLRLGRRLQRGVELPRHHDLELDRQRLQVPQPRVRRADGGKPNRRGPDAALCPGRGDPGARRADPAALLLHVELHAR
jgi:oligopeptide transport system substrate-binding protein